MATPRICVTITAGSTDELCRRRDSASLVADLVELRLDTVRDLDLTAALAGRRVPVVVACRPRREGGAYDGPEDQRLAVLAEAVRQGADFVEVEWRSSFAPILALRGGRGIVLASHDYDGVPADLAGTYQAMRASGAEVVKIAVAARELCDLLPLLDVARQAPSGTHTLLALGLAGVTTRVLSERFGCCWTYAGFDVDEADAPSASRLLDEFRFRSIGPATQVFGVAGNPIGHSLSPVMHNAAFGDTRHDAVYLPLQAASADDFLRFARALGISGASVTAPFKRDLAAASVPEAGDSAGVIGAVNTLKATEGGWRSRNTDVPGFLAPLDARGVRLEGCRASVIGAGGAARAVAFALTSRGARVTIHGRDRQRAQEAASVAPGAVATAAPPSSGAWDLLVNATPVGMAPAIDDSPVAPAVLAGGGVVYDLVSVPQRTRLLADATSAGCAGIAGLEMLVAQAARQFEWWTGRRAPVSTMQAAARRRLSDDHADEAGDR